MDACVRAAGRRGTTNACGEGAIQAHLGMYSRTVDAEGLLQAVPIEICH